MRKKVVIVWFTDGGYYNSPFNHLYYAQGCLSIFTSMRGVVHFPDCCVKRVEVRTYAS